MHKDKHTEGAKLQSVHSTDTKGGSKPEKVKSNAFIGIPDTELTLHKERVREILNKDK